MKCELFKKQLENNKNLKKIGRVKVLVGLLFVAFGLIIFFSEPSDISDGHYYLGGFGASGKLHQIFSNFYYRTISLLYVTLGKWNSSAILYFIGLIFIIWGIKDFKKNNSS